MKLLPYQVSFLKLIQRSKDVKEGWRQCSDTVFEKIAIPFKKEIPELVELDLQNRRIRFTEIGQTVIDYLI